MKTISESTFRFLCDEYERVVHDYLDDPDEQFTHQTHADCAEFYQVLLTVGKDCGVDFWAVAAKECTEYEIDRYKTMLKESGVEGFTDYEPQPDQ